MAVPDLIEYLHDEAGDALRAIGVYTEDEHELRIVRDDLDHDTVRERHDAIVENITWEWNPDENPIDELGRKHATVQLRSEAVIINLVFRDSQGVLIGLDPGAARDLMEFVRECRSRVVE